ncbi:PAS domain-containing protein [Paeniroseomonas aquatica]|uniref:PAS domain-containing protein n=1 Tax=Paeniroseomonas aquatica TaxID=373043 RepID=UPI00361F48FD
MSESEARFRALVEASAQIVWTSDAEGLAVGDSPSWRAFTGQAEAEWRGNGWAEAIHPEDRAAATALWRDCVARRRPFEHAYRLRHHAGGHRWTMARNVPLLGPDGELRAWVGMNIDIDEQRRAEAALRAVNPRSRAGWWNAPGSATGSGCCRRT